MAGNVTGRIQIAFLWRGRRRGRLRRWRLAHHLVEESCPGIGLLLAALPVPEGVLAEAGLANNFGHASFHHAGDGVVQQQLASGAVIINQITKPLGVFGCIGTHATSLDHAFPSADYTAAGC